MPVDNYGKEEARPTRAQPQNKAPLPYSQGKRTFYGITWAIWTILLFTGGISAMSSGAVAAGLLAWILAALTAHYDWRIWSWQAKHLWFLIII
jgi:hypothetical protein